MIRRPPRSTLDRSSAASDVYKRQRLYSKAETARELIFNTPENRIIGYLNSLRIDKSIPINKRILIDNTRQEIANFTGLRVETVIRTLKKMQKENKVEIINRKLFY